LDLENGTESAKTLHRTEEGTMDTDSKSILDPWDVGQITERLPAWEVWEDGVEPEDDVPASSEQRERAA
jgi:hypothetical protein